LSEKSSEKSSFSANQRHGFTAMPLFSAVGAGAKLDRDGSKLDTGDGAKLDFWGIAP
jgi:hypothetical protein